MNLSAKFQLDRTMDDRGSEPLMPTERSFPETHLFLLLLDSTVLSLSRSLLSRSLSVVCVGVGDEKKGKGRRKDEGGEREGRACG